MTPDNGARPVRLQLSRRKGFSLQRLSLETNGLPAVNVARPSKFGNPFPVINPPDAASSVAAFRRLFTQRPSLQRHGVLGILRGNVGKGEGAVLRMRTSLHELRGKNLACWCAPGAPCHASALLELANAPVCEPVE